MMPSVGHNVCRLACLLIALCALFAAAEEPAVPAYTLEQCIRIGLERSTPLANARRDEQIAGARVMQVRAQAVPNLSANGSYTRMDEGQPPQEPLGPEGREDMYRASLDASQLLYSGGSVRAALGAAHSYRRQAAQEVERQAAVLVRDITKSFYDVLFAAAAVGVAAEAVRQLEDFEAQSRLKYEHQTISEFDWLSAQVKLANERPKLILARNRLALARSAFRDLIYLEDNDFELQGELAYRPVETDLDALYGAGLAGRPELRQAEARIQTLDAAVRAARGGYLPQVRAVAAYEGDNPDPAVPSQDEWEWGWYAGLTASWSLFDGGLTRGTVLENALERAKARAELEDLKRNIQLEVKNAYLTLGHAREVVLGTQDSVSLAEKALEIARVRYEKGLSTYLEFSDSNLALSSARLIHNEALASYLKALADLRYACGTADLPAAPPREALPTEVKP
ncbi:MAG: TolC family protein [Kiritimatiellae bacterium]|nr:TolC family protein [Kiritimatiellia bacterium]